MDFNANDFANILKSKMYREFPYDPTSSKSHIRDLALGNNGIMKITDDKVVFEIGNAQAESQAPYYHILEDAQVITKRGRGTTRTKGSQDSIANLGQRDYGKITKHTTPKGNVSYFQEYRRNVRGNRSLIEKASDYRYKGAFVDSKGKIRFTAKNVESKYYVNRHYHYIEKMLDGKILQEMCAEYGLKQGRKQITPLEQDYDDMFGLLESEEDYE